MPEFAEPGLEAAGISPVRHAGRPRSNHSARHEIREELDKYTCKFKDLLSTHSECVIASKDKVELLQKALELLQERLESHETRMVDSIVVALSRRMAESTWTQGGTVTALLQPIESLQLNTSDSGPVPVSKRDRSTTLDSSAAAGEGSLAPLSSERLEEFAMPALPGQVWEQPRDEKGSKQSNGSFFSRSSDDNDKPAEDNDNELRPPPGRGSTSSMASVASVESDTVPVVARKRRGSLVSSMGTMVNRVTSTLMGPSASETNETEMSFQELRQLYGLDDKYAREEETVQRLHKMWCLRRNAFFTVTHPRFEPVCAMLVMLCSAQIGAEAHYSMQSAAEKEATKIVFRVLDVIFNTLFTAELAVRLCADGLHFLSCQNPSIRWNLMDFVLVVTALAQEVGEIWTALTREGQEGGMNLASLRVLRMMRLVRVARILRVMRFFSELRVMVNGILGSAKSLLWAFLLLVLVMFTVGVTLMQFAAMYIDQSEHPDAETVAGLKQFYGNLLRTLLTLYMAISGGIDWNDAVIPLRNISVLLELLFVGYAFFTIFCCLNIVTGIFVDNAKALKQADEEAMYQEALQERKRWIVEVAELFNKVCEARGPFTFEQFAGRLKDIRVQTIFRKLGIHTDSVATEELWEILDRDGSGEIDQEEFAEGIKHFHGDAKSIDMYRSRRDMKKMARRVDELFALTNSIFKSVAGCSTTSQALRRAASDVGGIPRPLGAAPEIHTT